MDHARDLKYSDFFTQLQTAQDLLSEQLGICLVLVGPNGKEMTLPSGLPFRCNDHRDCAACHAQFVSQVTPERGVFHSSCPNGLSLAALSTSIRTDEGALFLLAGRTTERQNTERYIPLLTSIYSLPFETPFPRKKVEVPVSGPAQPLALLTLQEKKVLAYIATGLGNRDIANRMGISQSTVKAHTGSILKKLKLTNRTEATVFVLQNAISFGDDLD